MSHPEVGNCDIQTYERGKRFIVTPDRLSVDGLYMFAFKARPEQDWQACQLLARVTNIKRQKLRRNYKVDVSFENPNAARSYPVESQGFVTWRSGPTEEGYFRHHLDGANDELEAIESEIKSGSEAPQVTELEPVAIS